MSGAIVGLGLSYRFDIAAGATIVLVLAAGFFAALTCRRLIGDR